MSLVRYEPWSLVPQLQDEINRVFNNLANADSSAALATWVPAVDIREYADRFELQVDLPGVEPSAVEITLEDGVLTLSGERTAGNGRDENEQAIQMRSERGHGRFHRRFILPETVDSERVEAQGRNGVLSVRIPKHPKAQPRRIKVAG
jgi:HSP20 family protein